MDRRNFFGTSLSAGLMQTTTEPEIGREYESGGGASTSYQLPVTVERRQSGQPHKGKVLAAIQPHCDDIPIYAGGLVLKLIDEGYTGYLITLSNDSMAGTGPLPRKKRGRLATSVASANTASMSCSISTMV